MGTTVTKTLGVRVKDKHVPLPRRLAKEANTVWNYCNQANRDHWRKYRQHLTGFDLNKLTAGSSPALQLIGDSSIQEVGQHYAAKRRKSGKSRLRWRGSNRQRRNCSLGWVPVKSRDTSVAELARELHVKPATLYRYVGPKGELRTNGKRVLNA